MKETDRLTGAGRMLRAALLAAILIIAYAGTARGEEKKERTLRIKGEVVESVGNSPLLGTMVVLLDSAYNPIDSMKADNMGLTLMNTSLVGQTKKPAYFQFDIPRKKGSYYLTFTHEKYSEYTRPLTIGRIGGRERERDLGLVKLERAPRQLKEVTVTATKIKFYHKGDTLVFNADAFELPEGSMLDALVAQLPGVEIKDNGRIYVNGRFVDNLILNGKDFFNSDPTVMLRNLGSYMVKDVAVYERQTEFNKFIGGDIEKKDYVMDVRLKKEYMHGWIANVEGGAGTSSRYLGRLFAMRYTDFVRVGLFANVNNLNDNGRQGQTGGFDPAKVLTGSRRHQNAGISFNITSRDNKVQTNGNVVYAHTDNRTDNTVTRLNMMPGGDTYNYRFSNGYSDAHMLRTFVNSYYNTSKNYRSGSLYADYSDYDNRNDNMEATFNDEQQEVTRLLLDSLYTPGNKLNIGELVNRVANRNFSKGHDFIGRLQYYESVKIPYSEDAVTISAKGEYTESRRKMMNLYRINTGADPVPTTNQGQWSDTKPNRGYSLSGKIDYTARFSKVYISPFYEFEHTRKVKNSQTYTLENLADLGIYGLTVPEGAEYSGDLSYWSTTSGNSNKVGMQMNVWAGKFGFNFYGYGDIKHNHLWYNRFNRQFQKARTSVVPAIQEATLRYGWGSVKTNYGNMSKNTIYLKYNLNGMSPNLEWLLPITDDTDPLNIYEGAESLKDQLNHRWELSWEWRSATRPLNHTLSLNYTLQSNTLVRGYTYNTDTGVRHIRSYNTSGNWTEGASSSLGLQFGPDRKMSLSNSAGISYGHTTDMIGRNVEVPTLSTIRNMFLTENLKLTWQVGKQNIGLKSDVVWRHTTSDRDGFQKINSTSLNYGLTGTFKLPLGFGLSTDLTMYMREGYNDPGLDKHDLVWNARLSRPFDHGRWVVMLDGFDLLHQLSNVTLTQDSQGRTVTYTNSLPRYILLHATYRIDIKPKKKF
ncbi:MAG: outer membrane beta-barrel family protein [Paramuribaculum sp.]|nr:outer membrane beta-barrel family protein [Paramuribaculum sp.]